MLTVRVSKKKWDRGNVESALLRRNGKMCCIGFLAKACGLTNKEIVGIQRLEAVVGNKETQDKVRYNYDELEDAYDINDDESITDIERIKQLRKVGKEMSVKFVFVP